MIARHRSLITSTALSTTGSNLSGSHGDGFLAQRGLSSTLYTIIQCLQFQLTISPSIVTPSTHHT